jgi:hypothetical protein
LFFSEQDQARSRLEPSAPSEKTVLKSSSEQHSIVAVLDIVNAGSSLEDKVMLAGTDYLRNRLAMLRSFYIVEKSRQESALRRMVKKTKAESYEPCYDRACQVPLGQALSADCLLSCRVQDFGGEFSFACELVDLTKEATTRAGSADFDGSPEGFRQAIDSVVKQIANQ